MLEISLFYGIGITMNWDKHNPSHFHVDYAGYKASVLIQAGIINQVFLPNRQLKLTLV